MKVLIFSICFLFVLNALNAQSNSLGNYNLSQLDSLYKTKKEPKERLPYALAMVQKAQKELDLQDTSYAKLLYKLGNTYQSLKDAPNAKKYLEQAIAIQRAKIPESAAYANSLYSLGLTHYLQGQFEEVEKKWLQVQKIRKQVFGDKHAHYTAVLVGLATLYNQMGDYSKSERFMLQALEIQKETLGEKHADYVRNLNSLGNVYYRLQNRTQAENLFLQALNIRKETLGEKHPLYAGTLSNLGVLYQDMEDYEKAERIYLEVLQIRKETIGEEHKDYAASLQNLGVVFVKTKNYKKAEEFYLKALEIYKKTVGEKNRLYADCLSNLAGVYMDTSEYQKAEPMYLKVLAIFEQIEGKKHPDYARTLQHLGILYSRTGESKKAEQYFAQMIPVYLHHLEKNGSTLGEKAKKDLFKAIAPHFNIASSFVIEHRTHDSLLILLQDALLLTKGYALTGVSEILPLIKMLNDKKLEEIYDAWTSTKNQLGEAYNMSLEERKKEGVQLDSLERLTISQEAELMRSSLLLKERLGYDKKRFFYKDLVNNINKNEVAIDFVRIEGRKDTVWYYAFVTQQGWAFPKLISLCTEKELASYTSAEINPFKESYITKPERNKELYKLLIQPLELYLKNKKIVHWSPVGIINEIALTSLKNNKNKMLMERFEIHQYGALKDFILRKQVNDKSTGSIDKKVLLVGDIVFDLDEKEHLNLAENVKDEDLYVMRSLSLDSTRGCSRFTPLKGTKIEIENLNKAFATKKWHVEQLQQKDALEEKIKEYSGDKAPSILHFATHGFFIPKQKQHEEENPLLRSGIALAGANRAWMGKSKIEGLEDGLWTAYEIANLDLVKTNLVVLSACETAKGQIDYHEGVLGLQRAFKIAGVENMLLSLWQIPDKETVELMEEFYKNYLNGESPSVSLRKAQAVMRKKYPDPYYWAAFVLIE